MPITALPTPPSRTSPSDFSVKADAFIAALPVFVTETNAVAAAMDLNDTTANSTTSLEITVASKSLTVDLAKSYQPGMSVKIAKTSSPSNWMHGDVTSYNAGTGALVVNVTTILGSGTHTDWTITLSGPSFGTSPTLTGTVTLPKAVNIKDTSADHEYQLAVSELTANRVVTLPLLTGADEFVFKDHTQTLANKTLTSPKINDTSLDHQYIFTPSELTANRVVTLPLLTGADEFVFANHTKTLTNKRITKRTVAVTSHATPTLNTDNADIATILSLAHAITNMSTNLTGSPVSGDMLLFRLKDDGTARAIGWGTSFEAYVTTLPTTTVMNKELAVLFLYRSKWSCVYSGSEA